MFGIRKVQSSGVSHRKNQCNRSHRIAGRNGCCETAWSESDVYSRHPRASNRGGVDSIMIRRSLFLVFVLAMVQLASGNPRLHAQANDDWHRPFPAFKIAGNLYYVGTADLAVYLINTPQGNILINSDFIEDVPLIRKSIGQLGFKYADTKILLISHAHSDHDEGVGIMQKDTHARLMVMDADVPEEESRAPGRPGAHVDRVLHDGDTVELGGSKLVAHLTPGHTKGCTTWTMQVREDGRALNVVVLGSANVNGADLVDNADYPRIADDYVKTFATLTSLPCDV